MLKVQVIGPTLFALRAPNLSSSAVSVLRKSRPSKNDITPSKRRTWTRTSNNSVRSSNVPLILGVPSTARTVWTSCSLPSSTYAVRTRFLGISSPLPSISLRSDFLFDDIEPLTVFANLITCSLTRLTTLIRVHRPLILKLSISQHRPPLR
jgi:hypothetical protein